MHRACIERTDGLGHAALLVAVALDCAGGGEQGGPSGPARRPPSACDVRTRPWPVLSGRKVRRMALEWLVGDVCEIDKLLEDDKNAWAR